MGLPFSLGRPRPALLLWGIAAASLLVLVNIPEWVPGEIEERWTSPPAVAQGQWFGTFQGQNLLVVVAKAARLTLSLSLVSLLFSIAGGIVLMLLYFLSWSRPYFAIPLRLAVYFPRLFCLIFLAAWLELYQPSRLKRLAIMLPGLNLQPTVENILVALLAITGAIFLAAQTTLQIDELRQQFFVYFATSLRISPWKIFFRHIFRNCTLLPIAIAKQLRDNILFLSTLSFIGLIELQSQDLGALICQYYSSPQAFSQGWWILFFPCVTLCYLILIFDRLSENIARQVAKAPVVKKI